MFTIKFYNEEGTRVRIFEAESFTILREHPEKPGGGAEITLHRTNGDDIRVDVRAPLAGTEEAPPFFYQKAIIENAAGKTTEIIALRLL